jgi:hypothetical protein
MLFFGGIIMTTPKLCSKFCALMLSLGISGAYAMPIQQGPRTDIAMWISRIEKLSQSACGSSCASRLSDELESFIKSKCSTMEKLEIRNKVRQPLSRFLLACFDAGALLVSSPQVSLECLGYTQAAAAAKKGMLQNWLKTFRGDVEVAMSKEGITTKPQGSATAGVADELIKTIQMSIGKQFVIENRPELAYLKKAFMARLSDADMKILNEFCKKPAFFKLKACWRELANRLLVVCNSDIRI